MLCQVPRNARTLWSLNTDSVFSSRCCIRAARCLNLLRQVSSSPQLMSRNRPQRYVYSTKRSNVVTPLFLKAQEHGNRVAVIDQHGAHSYQQVLHQSEVLCGKILDAISETDQVHVNSARIALLCPNDMSYVVSQWATWMCGGVSVPLSKTHPASEIEYFLENSGSSLVITTPEYQDKVSTAVKKLGIKDIVLQKQDYCQPTPDDNRLKSENTLTEIVQLGEHKHGIANRSRQLLQSNSFRNMPALIIYTSGTTGRPKGVVHTYGSLQAQIDGMVTAWQWTLADVILHVLPLHHVHGIVNALMTPLYCGATCVIMPEFDASEVWKKLLGRINPTPPEKNVNVFMAVPTIYAKMIAEMENRQFLGFGARQFVKATCLAKVRLMVSGSAALPQPIMEKWEKLTGHTLLERYGMTETGMVLTNPLQGARQPGKVGKPFRKVKVCIAKPNVYADQGYDLLVEGTSHSTTVTPGCEGEQGELYVKGPNLFSEYWKNPKATKETFTKDGWFKTGDTACYEDGSYKILGRTSVDIIKSGGYKISALDIERHLLSHPDIRDVAVVGLPDITWGQKVAAVLVLSPGAETLELDALRDWAKDILPHYQLPTMLKILDSMPRNAMGKVNKIDLVNTVFEKQSSRQ